MSMSENILYRLALARCDGIGSVRLAKLLQRYGSSEAVFDADLAELTEFGLSATTCQILKHPQLLRAAQREIELADQYEVKFLFRGDPHFPLDLAQSRYCPSVLTVMGQIIPDLRYTAVVGTRSPSPCGRQFCEQLFHQDLNCAGVVSGLALGIDREAHCCSLDHNIPNIAVLGHGLLHKLDTNGQLIANRIIEQGGAMVSQFSLWSPPERWCFPARNQVISGLCFRLVLIESRRHGGGMITVRLALQEGKEIFTYSGAKTNQFAQGPNFILSQRLARSLNPIPPSDLSLDPSEQALLALLEQSLAIDAICDQLSMAPAKILSMISQLEIKGLVPSRF